MDGIMDGITVNLRIGFHWIVGPHKVVEGCEHFCVVLLVEVYFFSFAQILNRVSFVDGKGNGTQTVIGGLGKAMDGNVQLGMVTDDGLQHVPKLMWLGSLMVSVRRDKINLRVDGHTPPQSHRF